MGGAASERLTTTPLGDGWQLPLTQGYCESQKYNLKKLNSHGRFLLASASMSEESLGRVCGEKFHSKHFSCLQTFFSRDAWYI